MKTLSFNNTYLNTQHVEIKSRFSICICVCHAHLQIPPSVTVSTWKPRPAEVSQYFSTIYLQTYQLGSIETQPIKQGLYCSALKTAHTSELLSRSKLPNRVAHCRDFSLMGKTTGSSRSSGQSSLFSLYVMVTRHRVAPHAVTSIGVRIQHFSLLPIR